MNSRTCFATLAVSMVLASSILSWSSESTHAATPGIALMGGVGTHQWTQHGIGVTYRELDLAIQGIGFFALQSTLGEVYLTRDGRFTVNEDGLLVYKDTDLLLLSSESSPIQIAENMTSERGAKAKTFRINLDGSIEFIYQDGRSKKLNERIGIALPTRVDFSMRSMTHLFRVSDRTNIYMGRPQEETRGSLYSSALEVLEPYSYALFENRFERPLTSLEGKYLVTTELTLTKNKVRFTTNRTRIINPSNQWLEFSSDDRVYFNGKLEETNSGIQLKWMAFTTDFSTCEPIELTSFLVPSEQRIFTQKGIGDCVAELRISVTRNQ
jgi:hypothetical protein